MVYPYESALSGLTPAQNVMRGILSKVNALGGRSGFSGLARGSVFEADAAHQGTADGGGTRHFEQFGALIGSETPCNSTS
jgi:hypothetical protein